MMHWYMEHEETMSWGDRIADSVATFIGSWDFIVGQAFVMAVWVIVNALWVFAALQFDKYPFVFLNLFMSAEAAFSTPLILMSQNRQAARDRIQAQHDYDTNIEAEQRIEALQQHLHKIETEKLDILLAVLSTPRRKKPRKRASIKQ